MSIHCLPMTAAIDGYPERPGLYIVEFGYDEAGDGMLRVCRWYDGKWWPSDEQPRSLEANAATAWFGPFVTIPAPAR